MDRFFVLVFMQFYLFYSIRNTSKVMHKRLLFALAVTLVVLFQGLRSYNVGIDIDKVGGYKPFFEFVSIYDVLYTPGYNFEKGFILITYLSKLLSKNFTVYLVIISFLIQFPILLTIYKESKRPELSILIYLSIGLFTFTFSGLRQSISLAILFYSNKYVKERNIVKFLVFVFISFLFHKSSLIFIPAYFVYDLQFKKTFYIGSVFTILLFNQFAPSLLSTESFSIYLANTFTYRMSVGLGIVFLISRILIYKNISFFNDNGVFKLNDDTRHRNEISYYSNLIFIAFLIQLLANTINNLSRLGYYYYINIIILIPLILNKILQKKVRLFIYIILILISIIYLKIDTGGGYLEVIPYNYFWEK